MNLLLNIDQKNFILSVVILTLVLVLLILVISEQFSSFKKKIKKGGFEYLYRKDTKKRDVEVNDFRTTQYVIRKNRNVTVDASRFNEFEKPRKIKLEETFILEKVKKRLRRKTGRKIASGIFYVLCLSLIGLSIYQHFNGTIASFGNTSYAVVPTKSMAASNEDNSSYLDQIEELNQIKPYSMVKLHKVERPEDVKLFGIYAYKNDENKLIIHRVVDVSYREDDTYYTFKGDNNSFADKKLVKASNVLYEYRGESNYPLGLIVGFTKSGMGFVALVYIMIGLAVIDHYESKKDKIYLDSLNEYVKATNKEKYTSLGKTRVVEI